MSLKNAAHRAPDLLAYTLEYRFRFLYDYISELLVFLASHKYHADRLCVI